DPRHQRPPRMLTPAQAATVLDRVLAYVAPQWAWRRAPARAWLLRQGADAADLRGVRERHGERWQRVDELGTPPYWRLDHIDPSYRNEPPPPARPSFSRRGWVASRG